MLMNPPPATYSPTTMNRQSVQPLGIPGLQNPISGNVAQATPVSSLPAMGGDQGMGGAGPALGSQPFPHTAFQPPRPPGGQSMGSNSMAQLLGQQS